MWFVTVCSRWQNGPLKVVCGEEEKEDEGEERDKREEHKCLQPTRQIAVEH